MSISDLILFVHDSGPKRMAVEADRPNEPHIAESNMIREAAVAAGFDNDEEIDPYHALLFHLKVKHNWDC